MKLISMTDFVLNESKTKDKETAIVNIYNYAQFLKQPLTLGMFVPCDELGYVLEDLFEGNDIISSLSVSQRIDLEQAKERVLFGNVSLQHAKWLVDTFALVEDISSIQVSMTPLYLTPQALKQIGI